MTWEELEVETRFFVEAANHVEDWVKDEAVLEALGWLARAQVVASNIAAELVLTGIEMGLTQKAMAEALGVSPSTLRGAREEAKRRG